MIYILPYKAGSQSVKKLKTALNAKTIRLENSTYRHKDNDVVINWGNSTRPSHLDGVDMLNEPEAVAVSVDKLKTFQALEDAGVATVEYTTDRSVATSWSTRHKVFVRNKLTGHSGEGIEVIQPQPIDDAELLRISRLQDAYNILHEDGHWDFTDEIQMLIDDAQHNLSQVRDIPTAPLYTKGVQNTGEYRVHVFASEVILYQKKSRRLDDEGNVVTADGEEADVRNLASNWVYRTGNLRRLERIEDLAINAIEALGLDFGAVDIIKDQNGDVFVLEVNSAPGLGNTDTLESYIEAINELN